MLPMFFQGRTSLASLWKLAPEGLAAVRGEMSGLEVAGWVALPQHARPTRSQQIFSINGRLIRSASLSQAVLEGFRAVV